jgi:VanZ family protein
MNTKTILMFRIALFVSVFIILYFTTTASEPDIAESINDKLSHGLTFLLLSLLADFSCPESKFTFRKVSPLVAYGVLIECIQYFLPYRSFSVLDILADIAGIALYAMVSPLIINMPFLNQRKALILSQN